MKLTAPQGRATSTRARKANKGIADDAGEDMLVASMGMLDTLLFDFFAFRFPLLSVEERDGWNDECEVMWNFLVTEIRKIYDGTRHPAGENYIFHGLVLSMLLFCASFVKCKGNERHGTNAEVAHCDGNKAENLI